MLEKKCVTWSSVSLPLISFPLQASLTEFASHGSVNQGREVELKPDESQSPASVIQLHMYF